MSQFAGSLRFVALTTALTLIAERKSTGRLRLAYADGQLQGEIVLVDGQMVAAAFGVEHGLAAVEAMVVGLADGEFNFVVSAVTDEATQPLIGADEVARFLEGLTAERERVVQRIPSLGLVPRLAGTPADGGAHEEVALRAGALRLIPALAAGQSIAQLAEQRGLGRTIRAIAELLDAGVICLDDAPVADGQSADSLVSTAGPSVSVRQSTTDATSVQVRLRTTQVQAPSLRRSTGPVPSVAVRPTAPQVAGTAVAGAQARRAALAHANGQQATLAHAPQQANVALTGQQADNSVTPGAGGWRRAVVRFFIADDTAEAVTRDASRARPATQEQQPPPLGQQAPQASPVALNHAS